METKKKIYYDNDGWVCERYPYDIPIEDEKQFIEASETDFNKTLACKNYHAWRVKDDKLVEDEYKKTPEEEIVAELRRAREAVCFPIINRGQLWYATLTDEQTQELTEWYDAWLNVTETKTEPLKPEWLV